MDFTEKEMTKYFDAMVERIVKCDCGHAIVFQEQTDRIICSWCNHWVYRNPKIKFKYKMMEAKNKMKNK